MRRPRAAFLVAVLLLLPAGCATTPTATTPDVVTPATWAKSVCQALTPWRARIDDLNRQAEQAMSSATTPTETKENLLAMLTGAEAASETARGRVAAAGLPDVTSGHHIADRFVAALAAMRDAYAKAHRSIQALDTSDPKAFYARVSAAMDTLLTEYRQGGLESAKGSSDELRRAFDEVPECH